MPCDGVIGRANGCPPPGPWPAAGGCRAGQQVGLGFRMEAARGFRAAARPAGARGGGAGAGAPRTARRSPRPAAGGTAGLAGDPSAGCPHCEISLAPLGHHPRGGLPRGRGAVRGGAVRGRVRGVPWPCPRPGWTASPCRAGGSRHRAAAPRPGEDRLQLKSGGRVRPASGEKGRNARRNARRPGCLGRRSGPGTWLSPRSFQIFSARPRPCFHPPSLGRRARPLPSSKGLQANGTKWAKRFGGRGPSAAPRPPLAPPGRPLRSSHPPPPGLRAPPPEALKGQKRPGGAGRGDERRAGPAAGAAAAQAAPGGGPRRAGAHPAGPRGGLPGGRGGQGGGPRCRGGPGGWGTDAAAGMASPAPGRRRSRR